MFCFSNNTHVDLSHFIMERLKEMLAAEILTAGGILSLIGLALNWLRIRVVAMEKTHQEALYRSDHQPIYVTGEFCLNTKHELIKKVDEIKQLMLAMDGKREHSKDDATKNYVSIEKRLTAIETKIETRNAQAN